MTGTPCTTNEARVYAQWAYSMNRHSMLGTATAVGGVAHYQLMMCYLLCHPDMPQLREHDIEGMAGMHISPYRANDRDVTGEWSDLQRVLWGAACWQKRRLNLKQPLK